MLSVNMSPSGTRYGSRAQVSVGIMMAPIMHLAHSASVPLVLLARTNSDMVRPCASTSRLVHALQRIVCTTTCLQTLRVLRYTESSTT